MRQTPNHPPFQAPCTVTASMKYCEQVGMKRQPPNGPERKCNGGEMNFWYPRTKKQRKRFMP